MLNYLIRTPPMPNPPLRRLLRLFLLNLAAAIVTGVVLGAIILFVGALLFAFGIPGLIIGVILVVATFGMITDMVEGRR